MSVISDTGELTEAGADSLCPIADWIFDEMGGAEQRPLQSFMGQ